MGRFSKILFGFAFFGTELHAVTLDDITQRYQLIGAISGTTRHGKPLGVAVIVDVKSGHSVTVQLSEQIPGSDHLQLTAVRRSQVDLTDGLHSFTLSTTVAPATKEPVDEKPVAKGSRAAENATGKNYLPTSVTRIETADSQEPTVWEWDEVNSEWDESAEGDISH